MNVRLLRLVVSDLFIFSALGLSACASHPDTAQQATAYE